jgi:hypothetical protein
MRMFLGAFAALTLCACAQTSAGLREIRSDPPGALVTIEGYGECETPCTVRLDVNRNVTIAKAGYVTQRLTLTPKGPPLSVALELAAPAGDVDTQALPEIE